MTAEPNLKPEKTAEGKRRRLTLMESYDPELSAFSTSKLSEISNTIRFISTPNENASPSDESLGEAHSETPGETPGIPSEQIVRPLCASPSQSPLGELGISPSYSSPQSPRISPDNAPHGETPGEIVILTSNQALLYECVKILNGRFTTLARVSKAVNISVDTLRSCLRKLRKIEAVNWSVENISGQNGMRISATIIPYAVRGNRNALNEKLANLDHAKLALNSRLEHDSHQVNHQVSHQASHQVNHQVSHQASHQISYSSSSSSSKNKKLLLRDLEISLLLEGHFQDLDVWSLAPYLDQFDSMESLQNFLDMANASIHASKTNAKPIQNPHGFLFAQLRAGYVNPPPGFKSRRVLAQEAMNAQLQVELDALRQLQAQEVKLRFELFKASLTDEQKAALEQEAARRVQPKAAVSRERQMEVYRDEVLREWFEQERG